MSAPWTRPLLVALVGLMAVLGSASPAQAGVLTTAQVVAERTAFEARVLTLVNVERRARGLRPVVRSACGDHFARSWSNRMAVTGVFAHQSLTPMLPRCSARSAGENIAYGNVSADKMMQMWMASTGHRNNILNARFTHLGVGAARTSSGRWYGTQDFLTL